MRELTDRELDAVCGGKRKHPAHPTGIPNALTHVDNPTARTHLLANLARHNSK
jgi:hypothetical protein